MKITIEIPKKLVKKYKKCMDNKMVVRMIENRLRYYDDMVLEMDEIEKCGRGRESKTNN